MIKHIVMWKLKDPADAPRFKAELDACSDLVPGTRVFEVAIRREALEGNCDVLLYACFDDAAALAAYQEHPRHKQANAVLGPLREARHVLDYEVQ